MCTKAFSRQLIMFAGMLIVECCNEMRWQKMVAVGQLLHGMSDITPTSLKPSWLSAFFNWRSCRQYHRVLSPALRWHKKNYNYWMQVNKLIESGLLKIAAISLTTKRREEKCTADAFDQGNELTITLLINIIHQNSKTTLQNIQECTANWGRHGVHAERRLNRHQLISD